MPIIKYEDQDYTLVENETVLEALLRQGISVPNGCRSGICHGCLLQVQEYQPKAAEQKGLTAVQRKNNLILACQCSPSQDIKLTKPGDSDAENHTGVVVEKRLLNSNVMRLRIRSDILYIPGQYITVCVDEDTARSYSLASHPAYDECLELHIKRVPGGRASQWVFDDLTIDDAIQFRGPLGDCVYQASRMEDDSAVQPKPNRPILMVAMGTGLAPIMGVLKDAIFHQHAQPIHLVIGAAREVDLYYIDEICSLIEPYAQIMLDYVTLEGPSKVSRAENIYEYCKDKFPDLKDHEVFACGKDSFVKKIKKQCFLSGADLKNIHADAFL